MISDKIGGRKSAARKFAPFALAASLAFCTFSDIARGAENVKKRMSPPFFKVRAGQTTAAEIKALLGAPWRTTNYGETYCGCAHRDFQEVWEYRGRDSFGTFKFHIELDDQGVAQTAIKIPDVGSPRAKKKAASKKPLTAER